MKKSSASTKNGVGRLWLVYCLALLSILAWLLARSPSPAHILGDPDGGQQLAGAVQILHGEHPFIDFRSNYGPLTFYASALGQLLSGHRFLGEAILIICGYALAYLLLFGLVRKMSGSVLISSLITVAALFMMPRYYKYYVVLGPVLSLTATFAYIEKPTRLRMAALGAAVAFAGLYRFDFGVYCAVCGIVAVVAAHWGERPSRRVKEGMSLLGMTVLWASPWLLWALMKGGLSNYFSDTLLGSLTQSSGLALPSPAYDPSYALLSRGNAEFLSFTFFRWIPAVSLLLLIVLRQRFDRQTRIKLLCGIILAQCTMTQSMHRADFGHLMQAIPISFLLLGWIMSLPIRMLSSVSVTRTAFAWMAAGLIFLPMAFPLWVTDTYTTDAYRLNTDIRSIARYFSCYAETPADFVRSVARDDPSNCYAQAMMYVDAHTHDDQRLLALPFLPSFYYFADRRFGGGQMLLAPGYFCSPADERTMISRMSRDDIPLIVSIPGARFDNRADRAMTFFSPLVSRYIRQRYEEVCKYEPLSISGKQR